MQKSNTLLTSQNRKIRFEHLTKEQELSNRVIISSCQDTSGFMWFGTFDGLNKFDGYKFTIFRHNPNDPSSISASHIRTIYVNKSGVLWIGTFDGGLNKFDREKEQFVPFQNLLDQKG